MNNMYMNRFYCENEYVSENNAYYDGAFERELMDGNKDGMSILNHLRSLFR